MATGSPVSFWYGTRAQFDSITPKLDTTLYFITDEQALYKGSVKFSGSGVDTLLTISSTQPSASSVTTGDKYFNTSDNLIHVLKNQNGTVTTTATYEPANGALYYNADAQRFQTLIKNGSSYVPTEIYDAGISVEDGTGLVLNGTTVGGLDATTNSKGVVQVGDNLNVSNGVLSVPTATNAVFGVVKPGDNITNNNGVLSVGKATTSSLGVVKVSSNINVDNNGQISVPVASTSVKGVLKVAAPFSVSDGTLDIGYASTSAKGVVKIALPFSISDGVLGIASATTSAKGVVQVGTNIDVNSGVISVKTASTSDKGVVQLLNEPASLSSETTAITPHAVSIIVEDLNSRKQDNMSATVPVDITNSNVSLNFGDGLAVGVAGSMNENKLIVNEATVEETLTDARTGVTAGITDRVVEPHDLKGALSVGQTVDVTSMPACFGGTLTFEVPDDFLGKITFTRASGDNYIGFLSIHKFPKFATGLKYLNILDVKNTSASTITLEYNTNTVAVVPSPVSITAGATKRIAFLFYADDTGWFTTNVASGATLEFTNWRQYEVTALTNEAIAYIAQLEDPDAFFRSTNARSIINKYLVKQDMVCPFIPTIEMENKDLTVAAGLSYKMIYKSNTAVTRTITADTIPTLAYGWDTHLQLFVDDNTTVNFQSPLVLEDPLIPNAGHNMTIKWRNGQALAYVDDTDVGYIVTVTAGTENGSLYYGLTNDVGEYITFANTTDGTLIEVDGVTITRALNIIGNGSDKTNIHVLSAPLAIKNTKLTVRNVSISQSNTSAFQATSNGTLEVYNCIVDSNTNNTAIINSNSGSSYVVISGCSFTNNTGTTDLVYTYTSAKYTNCYFNNPERSQSSNAVLTNAGTVEISGCTFASNRDNIRVAASCTMHFSDTNIINSTVSGAGTVVFADGATVTSIIPEGSTIGTGIIMSYMRIKSNCTLENVTISTVNDGSHPQNIGIGGACTVNFNNILVTGLTGSIWNGTDGTNIFKCTNVRLTNCDTNVHRWSGLVYYTDCDFGSLDISTSNGVLVLAGEIKANKLYATPGTYTGRIVITPGSIIRLSSAYTEDRTVYYVGNYNVPAGSDKVTGTIDITGNATLVFNGSTVSISGSGTTIDATGIHD